MDTGTAWRPTTLEYANVIPVSSWRAIFAKMWTSVWKILVTLPRCTFNYNLFASHIKLIFIILMTRMRLFYSCQNTEGSYTCICPHGLVGDPFKSGCKQPGDCFTDFDCPNSAACIDNRCTNPCDVSAVCGRNAECFVRDHVPFCRCPGQTTGNPAVSLSSNDLLSIN